MPKIKPFCARLNRMTDYTYVLLRGALLVSCTMTFCALLLLLWSGGFTAAGAAAYRSAQELMTLGAVTLFLATIGSVFVEEITMSRSQSS